MGLFLFFLFAVVAGLLWTAACTAGAARVERGWLKALLAAVGTGLPVIAVLPVVAATWWLAFGLRLPANWFPQAATVLVSLLVGGAWIVRAGLTSRGEGEPPAAGWPLVGLGALAVIATAVTAGVLLILDNAVAAQGPYLRLEAANLMQANLPPPVADADNAASLHLQAAAAIAADRRFGVEGSPIHDPGDALRDEVTTFLARHADTLAVIRTAADRDTCRFTRDWSRPSIDMLLPEIQAFRGEARLLALAARRAAAEGRHADALVDIVRMQRLARHAAAEPILISYLVALAVDRQALAELVELLPRLGAEDALLLDSAAIRDLVGRPLDLVPALHGEEAFGLATFAGFVDGRMSFEDVEEAIPEQAMGPARALGPIFRVFFLPGDIDGYRKLMHGYQQLVARRDASVNQAEIDDQAEAIEKSLLAESPGVLTRLLFPALRQVFRARGRDAAARAAAAVLVAATRQRLATGRLPLEPSEFTGTLSDALPGDPFAARGVPLIMKRGDAGLAVYSIGSDGNDDGGPSPADAEAEDGNDDVGFVMAVR